jgi:hypothetical protein
VRAQVRVAPRTALRVIEGRAHSGDEIGILTSVRDDAARHPTVSGVLACLKVETDEDYDACCDRFEADTDRVQVKERLEKHTRLLMPDTYTINDRYSMVIFRLRDDSGRVVDDFDLVLTADRDSPDRLPPGFFKDRQRNSRDRGTVTYYFNYDLMTGSEEVADGRNVVREKTRGAGQLGMMVTARPEEGFVHYTGARLNASVQILKQFLKPNQATLVEVVMRRLVRRGTYSLTTDRKPADFRKQSVDEIAP